MLRRRLCIAPVNGTRDHRWLWRVSGPKAEEQRQQGFRLWSPRRGDRVGVNPEAAAAAKEAEKAAKTDVIRQHEDNLGSRRKSRFSRRRSSAATESAEGDSFRSDTSYSDPAPPPPPPPRPASAQPPAPRRASRWRLAQEEEAKSSFRRSRRRSGHGVMSTATVGCRVRLPNHRSNNGLLAATCPLIYR